MMAKTAADVIYEGLRTGQASTTEFLCPTCGDPFYLPPFVVRQIEAKAIEAWKETTEALDWARETTKE